MINKPENIYDKNIFFNNYINLRNDQDNVSANEIIEMPAIYKELPDLKNKKVLDLGCGYGNNCKKAIDLGASYVLGTDISEKMIDLAKKIIQINISNIKLLVWKTFPK